MTRPYKLSPKTLLHPQHPLHWTRFWPDLQRLHRGRSEARQDLVLWLANLYHGAIRCGKPRGFCSVQVRLMDLRDWVRDYKPALEHFFEIKQLGYHFDEEHMELTTLVPKLLPPEELELVDDAAESLRYEPPGRPEENTVISKVYLTPGLDRKSLVARVLLHGRPEIVPQLNWLLTQPSTELNFHFQPSGKLKQRDTSVWPINAIETWPGWLREELFGVGIDLDSAYVQFLLHHLKRVFADRPALMETLFPDLIRLLHDKETFRKELCTQVLQRPYNEKYRGLIKQVIMSLANGSRISPALLTNGNGFSLTAELIVDAAPDATVSDLTKIGERLKRIADQFASARRYACMDLLKRAPNRKNVKQVFSGYFAWERQARYALWEAVGRHGIMVHDGLDGIPKEHLARIDELIATLDLRLTA
jgi:hypothetical protein